MKYWDIVAWQDMKIIYWVILVMFLQLGNLHYEYNIKLDRAGESNPNNVRLKRFDSCLSHLQYEDNIKRAQICIMKYARKEKTDMEGSTELDKTWKRAL